MTIPLIHEYINTQIHKCINTQIHKCINTYMHTSTHTHLNTLVELLFAQQSLYLTHKRAVKQKISNANFQTIIQPYTPYLAVFSRTCRRSLMSGTRCITEAVKGENTTLGNSVSHSAQHRNQNSVTGTIP